ncbi:MAG: NAD(P)-dependent oxidoreductase [Gemmatimonadetes bacterium]|nr:MAG: NAD(P)-dependent oxidoreductase [Gemmatimonadota bacterium]
MTRVLILGGGGMLGHKAWQVFRAQDEDVFVTFLHYDERLRATAVFEDSRVIPAVDAWKFDSIRGAIAQARPDWVLNCIGIIKQREEAKDPTQAIYVNALFPHLLSQTCSQIGVRLIHVSTDCVFSGRRGPYRETDPSDAEDLYGRTKYLGEVAGPGCLTIRTSIIGRGLFRDLSLVDWFLTQAGRQVRGYARTLYTGLTTAALSRELWRVVTEHPSLEGLYQVSSVPISKFDLLLMLNEAFHTGTRIVRDDTEVSDRSLVSDRYWQETGGHPPPWPEMIRELAADPTDYARFRGRTVGTR